MAVVAGIRGFREALQVRGRGGVGGQRRTAGWRASSGFWSGIGTELALFTAINSLPLTAHRFLFPPASHASRQLILLLVIPRLHRPPIPPRNNSDAYFSDSPRRFQDDVYTAETALSRKWRKIDAVRFVCLCSFAVFVPYALVYSRRNSTGRFARGNLKCKTETREDPGGVGRLPRGIFCGRDVPTRFAAGGDASGIGAAR